MGIYRFEKGWGFLYVLLATILFDIVTVSIIYLNSNYLLIFLLQSILVIFNIHQIYYLLLPVTLNLKIGENVVIINMFFGLRKIIIPFKSIIEVENNKLSNKGIKLSGFSSKSFSFGRVFFENIGTIRMFVTNNKNTIVIKTIKDNIAISPIEADRISEIISKRIKNNILKEKNEIKTKLYKDKYFIIPFMITTILIITFMLRPSLMYISGDLSNLKLPIAFNSEFIPVKYGTAKDFLSNQLILGALNMLIMVCMYFTEHIYSKYDRKASYKYMYIALFVITVFFILQARIIHSYT